MDQLESYMTNVTTVFFSDFEQSIHSAVFSSWPWTRIRGCRFHLAQSWWRKIQALGLSPEFKDKTSEIGNILKMFFGLLLLPPDQVVGCYVEDLFALKLEDNK